MVHAGKSRAQLSDELDEAAATIAALREQRDQFEHLVNSVVDYAIFSMDPQGRITSWNAGAERMMGWKADEMVGEHFRALYSPEDQGSKQPERNLRGAEKDGAYHEERMQPRKDGAEFLANVAITTKHHVGGKLWGFTTVIQDRTDAQQAESERRGESNAAMRAESAVRLDYVKDQLLDVFSHELRTPINAIIGYAMLLEDELEGSITDEQRLHFAQLLETSDDLLQLVNDFLDMARIQTGRLTLGLRPMNIQEVVENILAAIAPEAENKGVATVNEVGCDLPNLEADEQRVAQILTNLLSNAVKFTSSGGMIRVRACVRQESVRCEVTDTGIGIAPADAARVFDMFSQNDMSTTRRRGGGRPRSRYLEGAGGSPRRRHWR